MKALFKVSVSLGNKIYGAGEQDVPDFLYANVKFIKHVKAGDIVIHPRDEQAQVAQASLDARAMQKAVDLKDRAKADIDARAAQTNNKEIAG